MSQLAELNERARHVFRSIVENYLETGDPVGSKTLAEQMNASVSSATIRTTMSELEQMGLLYAPHVSAGRLPTEIGLRLFVDGLLQAGEINEQERKGITPDIKADAQLSDVVTQAVESLTGLSNCASLVVVPNRAQTIKHIEFVPISKESLLVIVIDERDHVENRIINRPPGVTQSSLIMTNNYLNARLRGRSLSDIRQSTQMEIETAEKELDARAARLVEAGLAEWSGTGDQYQQTTAGRNDAVLDKSLIVRGQAHLLNNIEAAEDLDRVKILFDDLERKKDLIGLLSGAEQGRGVKIFIGSETKLFSLSGSSLIVSGYRDKEQKIIGVLGVIAPTRSNYARLIPLVDHTARIVSKALGLTESK